MALLHPLHLPTALTLGGDLPCPRGAHRETHRQLLQCSFPTVMGLQQFAPQIVPIRFRHRRFAAEPRRNPLYTYIENALALTLSAQGDLAGARKLQEEVLDIQRRVLGPEHPETLASMNNLADTMRARGELAGARKLQEETLAICRRVLGPEHTDAARSMNNLALTLSAQGDLAGARKLQEEVLDIWRRVLGPERPNTSISAWNLFRTLEDLGEREAARAVLERDLLWLLDRDPATLGADQRQIREYVARQVKKNG